MRRALGIDTDGIKHPLGLWDGSTENATVATTLLANLTGRGLDVDQGVLVVLDGGKALRKGVNEVFGIHTPVQRCVRHKERNVLDHLPEHQRARDPDRGVRDLPAVQVIRAYRGLSCLGDSTGQRGSGRARRGRRPAGCDRKRAGRL